MSIKTYLSIDTETGGLDCNKHPLLQVGVGIYALDDSTLQYTTVTECEWNLKPSQFPWAAADPEAIAVNKLDLYELERNGVTREEACDVLSKLIDSSSPDIVLGQNLPFDMGVLRRYLVPECSMKLDSIRHKDLLDTSEAYNFLTWNNPDAYPSRSLGKMCPRLGVPNVSAHNALSDARATFLCLVAMFKKFREANKVLRFLRDRSSETEDILDTAMNLV